MDNRHYDEKFALGRIETYVVWIIYWGLVAKLVVDGYMSFQLISLLVAVWCFAKMLNVIVPPLSEEKIKRLQNTIDKGSIVFSFCMDNHCH